MGVDSSVYLEIEPRSVREDSLFTFQSESGWKSHDSICKSEISSPSVAIAHKDLY